jgi:selenocysteine-specific elongation factor
VAEKNARVPFRLPVDRVFPVDGFGTVVTGTMIEGVASVGDLAELLPSGQPVTIRNIQVHGKTVPSAHAGQRTALNLAGEKKGNTGRVTSSPSAARSALRDARRAPERFEGFEAFGQERFPGCISPRR